MKRLAKVADIKLDSIEAYACSCITGCYCDSCPCPCGSDVVLNSMFTDGQSIRSAEKYQYGVDHLRRSNSR